MAADLERLAVVVEADLDAFDQKLAQSTGKIRSQLRVITSESSRMSGEVERGYARLGAAAGRSEKNLKAFQGTLGGVGAAAGDMARDLATGGTSIGSIAASIASAFGPAGAAIGLASAALIPLIQALSDAEAASRDLGPDVSALRDSLADLKSAAADADGAIVGFAESLSRLATVKASNAIDDLRSKIHNLIDDSSFQALPEAADFGVDPAVTEGWVRLQAAMGAVGRQQELTEEQARQLLDALQAVAAAPMGELAGKSQDALRVISSIVQQAGGISLPLQEAADAVQLAGENAQALSANTDAATAAATKLASTWQQVLAASQAAMAEAGRAEAQLARVHAQQQEINDSRPVSASRGAPTTDFPINGEVGGGWDRTFPLSGTTIASAAATGGGGSRGSSGGMSSGERAQQREDAETTVRQQQAIQASINAVYQEQARVIDRNKELSDAFASVFVSAIDGSRSLQESLADPAKQLAEIMLSKAFQQILNGGMGTTSTTSYSAPTTSSSGGTDWAALAAQLGTQLLTAFFLARGGPAKAGKPYVVGERGPEIFVPKTSGTVVPNNRIAFTAAADGSVTSAPVRYVHTHTYTAASPHAPVLAPHSGAGDSRVPPTREAPTPFLARPAAILDGLRAERQGVDSPADVHVHADPDLRELLKLLARVRTSSRPGAFSPLVRHVFPEVQHEGGDPYWRVPVMHAGGTVGSMGVPRVVPSTLFEGARRYHRGGVVQPNEIPIIARRGETVLPVGARFGGDRIAHVTIDVRGATGNAEVKQMVSQGVAEGLKQADLALADKIAMARRDPRKRGHLR